MSELTKNEFEKKLIDLIAADPDPQRAREKMLADAKTMVEKLLGTELPDNMKVIVHQEDANTLHFVLPPATDELNAAELAAVAGGVCWDNCGDQCISCS